LLLDLFFRSPFEAWEENPFQMLFWNSQHDCLLYAMVTMVSGLNFRPSTYKSNPWLSHVATNLHWETVLVTTPQSAPAIPFKTALSDVSGMLRGAQQATSKSSASPPSIFFTHLHANPAPSTPTLVPQTSPVSPVPVADISSSHQSVLDSAAQPSITSPPTPMAEAKPPSVRRTKSISVPQTDGFGDTILVEVEEHPQASTSTSTSTEPLSIPFAQLSVSHSAPVSSVSAAGSADSAASDNAKTPEPLPAISHFDTTTVGAFAAHALKYVSFSVADIRACVVISHCLHTV
jgi:hypothetical protein